MNIEWILIGVLICYLSFLGIRTVYEVSKINTLDKSFDFGRRVFYKEVTYTRAFLFLLIRSSAWPLIFIGVLAVFCRQNHFVDALILGAIIFIPPLLYGVDEALKELIKKEKGKRNTSL